MNVCASVCTYILLSAWVLHSEMMLGREWGWFPSDLEKGAQSVSASHHPCLKPPPSLPGKTESSSLHIYVPAASVSAAGTAFKTCFDHVD